MPARFDDSIPFSGETVIAIGPLHPNETIKEVCAWVYQPTENRAGDAAATEMTTDKTKAAEHFQQVDGVRWLLNLKQVSAAPLRQGRAFAVAIALTITEGSERVVWWGQPVDLFVDEDRVRAADTDGALTRAPLKDPAPFPPPGSGAPQIPTVST